MQMHPRRGEHPAPNLILIVGAGLPRGSSAGASIMPQPICAPRSGRGLWPAIWRFIRLSDSLYRRINIKMRLKRSGLLGAARPGETRNSIANINRERTIHLSQPLLATLCSVGGK